MAASARRRLAVPERTRLLLRWFGRHRRPLPWRRDRDPYRIWVAEVLLQQTRVAQAVPYFERFVRRFPTIASLARGSPQEVLKLWQGAGYYARGRNLHAAARILVRSADGRLPTSVEDLQRLPGIGPYLARAIASLAFDAPVLALETNGRRIAARWWAERGDPRDPAVAARLGRRLEAELPRRACGRFNEALMEFGETVCRPIAPRCGECPVSSRCRAFQTLTDPGSIPRRAPKRVRPHLIASVVIAKAGRRWLVQQRAARGLLGGLYEFPGGKVEPGESPRTAARREMAEETGIHRLGPLRKIGVVRHAYSHFSVDLHVFGADLRRRPKLAADATDRRWVTPSEMRLLPLPKATEKILDLVAVRSGTGPEQPSHSLSHPRRRREIWLGSRARRQASSTLQPPG